MKNPEILKFFPYYFNTKKCVKMQLKLLFVLRYIPDRYKTQQIWDKGVLENGGTLNAVPDCYKNKKRCDKVVGNCPYALEFVLDCFIIQKV